MAQHGHASGHGNDGHDGQGSHGAHGDHAHGDHPTAGTYVKVGALLTAITAVEVSAYYYKPWEQSPIYVPSMLILSAIKFVIVVMVYMHLKYDHKLFRALFTGPFIVAALTLVGLMFLFGQLAIRVGLLT